MKEQNKAIEEQEIIIQEAERMIERVNEETECMIEGANE